MDVDKCESSSSSSSSASSHNIANDDGGGNDDVGNFTNNSAAMTTLPIMTNATTTATTTAHYHPDPAIVLPLLLGLLRGPPTSHGGGADEYHGANDDDNNNNDGLAAGNSNGDNNRRNSTGMMSTAEGGGEDEHDDDDDDDAAVAEEEDDDDLIPPRANSNSNNLYARTRGMNFPRRLHRLLSRGESRSSSATTTSPETTAITTKTTTILMKNAKSTTTATTARSFGIILSWSDHGRSFIVRQVNATTAAAGVIGGERGAPSHHQRQRQSRLPMRYLFDDDDDDVTMDNDNSNNFNNTDVDMNEAAVVATATTTTATTTTTTLEHNLIKFENELLYTWGFRQKKQKEEEEEKERKEYYHPLFLRGQFHLLDEMIMKSIMSEEERQSQEQQHDTKNNDDDDDDNNEKTKKRGSKTTTTSETTTSKKGTRKAETLSPMDDIMEEEEGDDAMDADADSTAAAIANNHAFNNNNNNNNDDDNNNEEEEEDAELVVKINDFLSFTGTTNINVARRYLDMSGNNLEVAVSLYMEMGDTSRSIGGGGGGESSIEDDSIRRKKKGRQHDNDDEDEEEEEPDFDALPPMPPLEEEDDDEEVLVSVSPPPITPAEVVFTKALHIYQSHCTIRRALLRYIVNRRIQQQQQQGVQQVMSSSSSSSSSSLAMKNQYYGTKHYLFQSLIHPSLLVRRAAARIILHNYHRIQQRSSRRRSSNDGLVLREALLVLLHSLMFGESPFFHHHTHSPQGTMMVLPRYKDQYDGGDPTLQVMGLLTTLICDGGFTNLLVCDEIQQQHSNMSSSKMRIKTNVKASIVLGDDDGSKNELSTVYGIESFVAGGGLRWACGSILRLVHMLVYGLFPPSSSSSSTSSHPLTNEDGGSDESLSLPSKHYLQERKRGVMSPLDEITSRTVQTRLRLMIDLVYRLVLFGSVPAAVDRDKLLLSTATMRRGDDGNVDANDGSRVGGGGGTGTREGTSLAAAADNAVSQSTRELHDFLSRNDGTAASSTTGLSSSSYASALLGRNGVSSSGPSSMLLLRQSSMRNATLGHSHSPATMASGLGGTGTRRQFRGANIGGSSLANLGGTTSSFSASDGGGGGGVDPVSEESRQRKDNRQRRDNRQAALERVNNLFWSSTLPAAVYDIPTAIDESEVVAGATTNNKIDDDAMSSSRVGQLSPLACLIAAHQILRSRPQSHSTLATNNQHYRAVEKGIAILGRIVDPHVSTPLVVVDSELPWELGSQYLLGGEGGNSAKSSKKRGRAYSNESHRSRSSSTSSQHATITRPMPPPRRRVAGGDANIVEERHQNKRARTSATTLSSVSSLLERLTRVDAGSSSTTAASLSEAGLSSTYAARYRTAMESMMRSTTAAGAASSGSATSSTAASTLRNSRDGSLSRLLASTVGGTERLGLSRPSPPAPPLPIASSAARSSLLSSNALAIAAAEVEEWRVLHELPEGGDVMDVDENDFSNDDDNDDDDDEEFVGNSSNVNDEGESGEVEEVRDHSEADDDEDSAADSAFEEVPNQPDNDNEFNEPETNNNNEEDDDSASDDEAVVAGDNNAYEEETDDDDEAYNNSQFDDAVINLDDINLASSDHRTRNPHRQSRSNAVGFRSFGDASGAGTAGSSSVSGAIGGLSPIELELKKREREQNFLCAAMSILAAQFPALAYGGKSGCASSTAERCSAQRLSFSAMPCATIITPPLLTSNAEQSLLKSLCNIVKPPRKPLNLKIFMRRAPTQEEFFRGNLNKNPIALSSLRAADAGPSNSGGGGGGGSSNNAGVGGGSDEPLVSDLRMHIAKDLQMEDSAEMLELLVSNKILDMNLKLRVVQQVLWKKYVEENATSASSLGVAGAGPSHQMISTGSGLSMIFSSSGLVAARSRANAGGDENTILESFPPMVVTYRLAGVDGEATEDTVEVNEIEDPEAPSTANQTPAAIEQRMEKEFGITRMMLQQQNGVAVLLASVQGTISDLLRRIRRDEVARRRLLRCTDNLGSNEDGNITREQFAKSAPCPGLVLLRLCANISDNRKKMLANHAPTLLLRMLLDILNAMNRSSGIRDARQGGRNRASTFDFVAPPPMDTSPALLSRKRAHHVEGNPTTNVLQEIIELLASDISAEISDESTLGGGGSFVNLNEFESGISQQTAVVKHQDEDRTLPLVMKSLHSTDLSPPLRKVIAKLLPFLTYGQVSQSKELASYFNRHFNVDRLGMMSGTDVASDETEQQLQFDVLMNTFVEAAINLPPVSVCDNLRKELISNGFVERVRCFLLEDAPSQPPSWSPALYTKSSPKPSESYAAEFREQWKFYFDRPGLKEGFKILTGLCSRHHATQLLLSDISSYGSDDDKETSATDGDDKVLSLLTLCHWIESTSDNTASNIKNPNGILAETFLDALKEDNELSTTKIDSIRKKTRDRKRELAEERRNKALVGMSVFGKLAGAAVSGPMTASTQGNSSAGSVEDASSSAENRSIFASMFASYLPHGSASQPRATRASSAKESTAAASQVPPQPSWMAEMEAMADEAGVTCAICQEGRTFQPAELLGLYAYTKKITVPSGQGGGKGDIDGTVLLLSLPLSLPSTLIHSTDMQALFTKARSAANALEGTSHALSISLSTSITGGTTGGSSSRANYYTTTVSAGNAIHISCHKKAKTADRNHPKAPKSEWEGASLRNSRVTCNVILPLVSSETATVPLLAIESALTDYNSIIMNTLGARPKSSLWNCLHDVRFLLLRMAHGEALGADCGGGSSSSNFLLLLYQLYSADLLAKNAEHDESLEVSRHARGLSSGFLVGVDVVDNPDFDRADSRMRRLERSVAASAPMAALLSILFYNTDDNKLTVGGSATKKHDISGSADSDEKKKGTLLPSPTRQWEVYKSKFLVGLMRCAGHRHSIGVTDSGCVTSRGISTGRKNIERVRSYKDWTTTSCSNSNDASESLGVLSSSKSSRRNAMIEDYSRALRPMITLYAIFDQLSKEFVTGNSDEITSEASEHCATRLDLCYKSNDIYELLRVAEITVGHDVICKCFEKGATSC